MQMSRSAIITVTQGDFEYIDEWIQYHHNIGYELILIGYNGNVDNMNKLPKYDYVRYIDFSFDFNNDLHAEFNRKNKGFSAIEGFKPKCDLAFMNRCLCILLDYVKFFYKDFQYVSPIDTDEFITIDGYDNINDFLYDNYNNEYPSMQFLERIMDDNDLIYYEKKPVTERFTRISPKLQMSWWSSKFYNYKSIINAYHKDVKNDTKILSSPHNLSLSEMHEFDSSKYFIRHFYTKSLEEYLMKFKSSIDNDYSTRFNSRMLYNYFHFNILTDEKLYKWNELCKKYDVKFDIYSQTKPSPYHNSITRYCKLFNKDFNVLKEKFEKENKLNEYIT